MPSTKPSKITGRMIEGIAQRLSENKPVRRTLPDGGRLHVDRQLPFMVVYRPPEDASDALTAQLVRGEASYLVAPRGTKHRRDLTLLTEAVANTMVEAFGAFLIIEVWAGPGEEAALSDSGIAPPPGFRVVVPRRDADAPSVAVLLSSLKKTKVLGRSATVDLAAGSKQAPPLMPRLSRNFGTANSAVQMIGIEVRPIYRDGTNGEPFPGVVQSIHRQLSRSIQQSAYEFAVHQTTHRPRHYQALGRRAFIKAVTDADRRLADVASAFDMLLLVTPVNTEAAYRSFRRSKSEKPPLFRYRPVDANVVELKRALYNAPIERVEDPTIASILAEKQRELSLKLDLISDRFSSRFLYTGVALYGNVSKKTVDQAQKLIKTLDPATSSRNSKYVDSKTFAAAASKEIEGYRSQYPSMSAGVEIRDDVSSLMVSSGNVLVGSAMRIPSNRVDALIQHEVGTHVVTYWNGRAQPFRLLATGLAGHDELQEGLAVLAEYLVAGLTPSRLRTIAARVLAVRAVLDGAQFIDTYRLLTDEYHLQERAAFLISTRVHRGGGLVKDAIYLRGLQAVTRYLAQGRRLDTLLTGKISVDHVAVIEELQRRGVLVNPPLRPAYLDEPDTHYRLERLRGGIELEDLVDSV